MTDEAQRVEAAAPRRDRVDWRTGRPMVQHDDAFWRELSGEAAERVLAGVMTRLA